MLSDNLDNIAINFGLNLAPSRVFAVPVPASIVKVAVEPDNIGAEFNCPLAGNPFRLPAHAFCLFGLRVTVITVVWTSTAP
jgi:hypothetical protein